MITEIAIGQTIMIFRYNDYCVCHDIYSYKLKQPLVIGYIIEEIIIGPHTPPFSLILNYDIFHSI